MTDEATTSGGGTSRRRAIGMMGVTAAAGAAGAAAPARAAAPLRLPTPAPALAPQADLVNVLEYEAQARLVLGPARAAPILGGDRSAADRITLHPRMNIPTRDLDLTSLLFGAAHFAPIVIGPIADQTRFHPEGEAATARGASAAGAAMVVSRASGAPLATIARATTAPLWLEVEAGGRGTKDRLAEADAAGVGAVVVTVGAGPARIDWTAVEAVARATSRPLVVKGVTRPQDAREAVARGAKGLVVSTYRGGEAAGAPGALLLVAPVAEAVGGEVPVLADGDFRRGTDILKALAFGAKGVLIGRPAMWGLAAYGADGVQGVMEMLQTELARYMSMCGCPTLAAIHPSLARVHAPVAG